MEVILLQDIDNLGTKHDVVTVKNGYGRNYLIPKKFALVANEPNMAKLENIKEKEEAKIQEMLGEFRVIASKLESANLKIGAKAGSEGKIFGSVTNIQLAQAIQEQMGHEVDRKLIHLDEDIKTLGSYSAKVNFHKDVVATLNFDVVKD